MFKKKKWWVATLLILLLGIGAFFIKSELDYAKYQEGLDRDQAFFNEKDDSVSQQAPGRLSDATSERPPPLGETVDTGYWEGDTWHIKPVPKPKKRGFWSEDIDALADRIIYGPDGIGDPDRFPLAQRIIREYPYSEAALKMRYVLMSYDENGHRRIIVGEDEIEYLKGMLKYHPNSPRVLTDLASSLCLNSPEEAIAFGHKSLRSGIVFRRSYTSIPSSREAHEALAIAYQRLGDYKTALVHLKAGQKLSDPEEYRGLGIRIDADTVLVNDYEEFTYEISMIEAGTPRYGPDPKPMSTPSDVPLFPSDGVTTSPSDPDPQFDLSDMPEPSTLDDRVVDTDVPSLRETMAVRAREAIETARSDYEQQQREKFDSFLRWMETIEQAKSPADLEDFLMREIATQLQGGQSEFTPERLLRAYETMSLHGEAAGMRELEKLDATLAREIMRQHTKNRVPPRPQRTPPNRKK